MARVTKGDVLTVACQTCQTSFTYTFKQGRRRRYCSQRCQDNRRRPAIATAVCPVCHESFGKIRERIVYCSKSCASRGWQGDARLARGSSSPVPWVQCRCGKWVVGRRGRRHCSVACAEDAARDKAGHLPRGSRVHGSCKQCADTFTYLSSTKFREFCSTACRKTWMQRPEERAKEAERRRQPKRRMSHKAAEARRRALKRGATADSFTHEEIFKRDGWRCGLCGKSVLRSAKWPHPRSPSLDHIVPLAKGGDHTRANVQCACLGCNTRKGDRLLNPEQLRLVG